MLRLVWALLIAVVLAQCAAVDIVAPRLWPSLVARVVVSLDNGVAARGLSEPLMGRAWATFILLAVCAISLCLPVGWGLSAALLTPIACAVLKSNLLEE